MPRQPNNLLVLVLGFFLVLMCASAQVEGVAPVVPGQVKEKEKVSFLRIWNFSGKGDIQRLGVFLRKKNDPSAEVVWIGRGVRYGTMAKYRSAPEGVYELMIVVEAGPIDSEKPVKFDETTKNEVQNIEIVMKQSGYQTLLIQEENQKIKASVADDMTSKEGLFTLRAVNFTDSGNVSILQVLPTTRQPFFGPLEPGKMQVKELTSPGKLQMEMVCYDEQGYPLTQAVEIDPSGLRGASMVVFYDRYGRVTFRCPGDAPIHPDVE